MRIYFQFLSAEPRISNNVCSESSVLISSVLFEAQPCAYHHFQVPNKGLENDHLFSSIKKLAVGV